jgi:low temperature requirement protein LtrA
VGLGGANSICKSVWTRYLITPIISDYSIIFCIIMMASLSVNFDQTYIPFFISYVGLRAMTAIQYLSVHKKEAAYRKITAHYLGSRFWIGLMISSFSLFFHSWIRYAVLYAGIAVDILIPLIGRKYLVKTPINTHHLLERFSLFTLILLGSVYLQYCNLATGLGNLLYLPP